MKATLMHETGTPQVLLSGEVETPRFEDERQLLVRLRAAGSNPSTPGCAAKGPIC